MRWPWQKKKDSEKSILKADLEIASKITKAKTMYANNYQEVGMLDDFIFGGVQMDPKTGKTLAVEDPKLVYCWLDPNTGMDENKAWLLLSIKGHFFELRVEKKEDEEMPRISPGGKAYSLAELKERIKLGDYDEMYNENTDKTVTEELTEFLKTNKLN